MIKCSAGERERVVLVLVILVNSLVACKKTKLSHILLLHPPSDAVIFA